MFLVIAGQAGTSGDEDGVKIGRERGDSAEFSAKAGPK